MTAAVTDAERYARPSAWSGHYLVDADVHVTVPSMSVLEPYLDPVWRAYVRESGLTDLESNLYPVNADGVFLPGARPDGGAPAGSSLQLTRDQLLDPWDTRYAVLNCSFGIDSLHNDDLAAALATATNRWQLEHWLQEEQRLRGSALVPLQNPELAAMEIDRLASVSEFVQVTLPVRAREPLGRRAFWPIYEAAQRAGVVVGIQAGGVSGNPITSVGWPTHYLEDYVVVAQAFQSQVLSLVSEGVFAEFPDLRFVMIEAGFTWLPSLMWRFDKNWKGLRREIPWVKQPPSEIIRDRMRFTTQPLDSSYDSPFLADIIDQIDAPDMLLFSTDYPHAQFAHPEASLPAGLSEDLRRRILSDNALATYRF